ARAAAAIANAAQAGNYLGDVTAGGIFRWPDNRIPVTVFIKAGNKIPGYRPEFDETLRQSFDDWTQATNGKFPFKIVDDPAQAEITVTWTDDMHAPALQAEAGLAQLESDGKGIDKAEITLLTVDPFKEGPLGNNLLHNVCLHEIGHAL